MIVDEMLASMMKEIKKNLEHFCGRHTEGELTPESASKVADGLQKTLAVCGQAGLRTFLESKDDARDVIPVDGELYRYKMDSSKTFETLFGKMAVNRRLYQNAKDTKSFVPLDAAWNMSGESMTVEVREALAYSCALMTPEETCAVLEKCAAFHPHPTQIKACVRRIGEQIDAQRELIEETVRTPEHAPEATQVIVASMDGVNVLLRQPGAKKGRPAERPTGTAATQCPSSYKNAMVGSLSFYGAVPEGETTPERLESRYVAHMPEAGAPAFKQRFEAELAAAEAQSPHAVKVFLCDGARAIWSYAANTPMYEDYEWLVDFYHTTEHLSKAAEALFGKSSREAAVWFRRYKTKLLEHDDGAQRVLNSMSYHAKQCRLSKSAREQLAQQRTFFQCNQTKMRYAEFRRRGLPIGSGPVEAACKSIVKNRMCRSGMRWSKPGGQHILDLRTYVKSNRWEAFWKTLNDLPKAM